MSPNNHIKHASNRFCSFWLRQNVMKIHFSTHRTNPSSTTEPPRLLLGQVVECSLAQALCANPVAWTWGQQQRLVHRMPWGEASLLCACGGSPSDTDRASFFLPDQSSPLNSPERQRPRESVCLQKQSWSQQRCSSGTSASENKQLSSLASNSPGAERCGEPSLLWGPID